MKMGGKLVMKLKMSLNPCDKFDDQDGRKEGGTHEVGWGSARGWEESALPSFHFSAVLQ